MDLVPPALAALVLLGVIAGLLGALVGIGGGVVVVPGLIVGFGFDVRVAVATSLVAVIATSTAAGAVYVGRGQTNMRLGMTLEIATTLGGITGGLLATSIPPEALAVMLALLLLVTSGLLVRGRDGHGGTDEQRGVAGGQGYEVHGELAGGFVDPRTGALIDYRAEGVVGGSLVAGLAGLASGLLGVGGGFLKVPAMDLVMRVPVKVAAATSNFMIGVTALSSTAVYAARGYVLPLAAAPVALGVVGGALVGTRLQGRASPALLRRVLAVVLLIVAVQLLISGPGADG